MVTMKDHEEKSENNAIYHHNKKNKMPKNKPMQGGKKPVCRKLLDIGERNQR